MCLGGCTPQNGTSSSATTSTCASCSWSGEGGTTRYDDDAVTVTTGATLKNGGNPVRDDTIQMQVKCSKDPHVLQFINREIIDAEGNRVSRTMNTSGGTYQTTTDPANPVWNTDSGGRPSPYYEAAGASCNCPGQLTTWDQPSLVPSDGETWNANFSAFIICDGKVIRRVDWTRSQTDGGTPSYSVNVTNATELPSWATDTMAAQGYTYP